MSNIRYAATFEVELTDIEIEVHKQVSEQLGMSIGDSFRKCANERAEELLKLFKENVPQSDEDTL